MLNDLTARELSMLLLTKLNDDDATSATWCASKQELLEIAEEHGITHLSDEDILEVFPLGIQATRASAAATRRAQAYGAKMTDRFERARIARAATKTTLPSLFLVGQIFLLAVFALAKQRHGSLGAAKEAAVQWLGWAPPPPLPPCPKPAWWQRVTPWLNHRNPEHCTW